MTTPGVLPFVSFSLERKKSLQGLCLSISFSPAPTYLPTMHLPLYTHTPLLHTHLAFPHKATGTGNSNMSLHRKHCLTEAVGDGGK